MICDWSSEGSNCFDVFFLSYFMLVGIDDLRLTAENGIIMKM